MTDLHREAEDQESMCVVSMIYDHYTEKWPEITTSTFTWTQETEKTALDLFEEIVRLTEKLDSVLGMPDCEDPKKKKFLDAVRERVRKHESDRIAKRLDGK